MVELSHGEHEATEPIRRGLALALALCAATLVVEAVGALLSHSLSLTADAAHDVPDLLGFGASYLSLTAVARGRTDLSTFGMHRSEVFAALLNGAIVLATGAVFAYPALLSLADGRPPFGAVDPVWIFAAAAPTLAFRAVAAWRLGRLPRAARDLNVRSVVIHLASDVLIVAALLVVGVVLVVAPGAAWVDWIAALGVAAILVYESIPIFAAATDVLTERVPRGIDPARVTARLVDLGFVREVHDLHIWAVCPTLVCLSAHVRVDDLPVAAAERLTGAMRERLSTEFGIVHAVFELEAKGPAAAGARAG